MPQRTVPVWMPTRMLTDSLRSSSKSWMAEIMARPISTQFRAWSFFGSGQPTDWMVQQILHLFEPAFLVHI